MVLSPLHAPGAQLPVPEPEWALVGPAVADVLAEAVLVWGHDGRLQHANQAAADLWGVPVDELIGLDAAAEIFRLRERPVPGAEAVVTGVDAVLHDAIARDAEGWVRRVDGSFRAVAVRTAPMRAGAARLAGAVQVLRDTTDLQAARMAAAPAARHAMFDPATGMPGRALAEVLLAARQDDLDRHGHSFGLLLLQPIPSRPPLRARDAGHPAWAARLVRCSVRPGDTVVAWDESTIGVIASHVDDTRLRALAQRLVRLAHAGAAEGGDPRLEIAIGAAAAMARTGVDALVARALHGLAAGRERHVEVLVVPPASRPARTLGIRR